MKNALLLLLLVFPLCALCAAGSLGKPRYNDEVALNEVVHLEISTLLPKVGIEPEEFKRTIVSAMDMPNNRPNWSLAGDPAINVNDKSRFIMIKIDLLPRRTGTLRLPEIPMEWLGETKIPKLGEVTVREEITIGNNTQALPIEIKAVGGFPWDADIKELKRKLGDAPKRSEDGQDIYTTRDGLDIVIRQERMAAARIKTSGWHLRQARFNFIDRWGDPRVNNLNSNQPHMIWRIGWLHIEARESVKDGIPSVTVYIHREDVESKLVEASMEKQIFNLLESDQTTDNIWEKKKRAEQKASDNREQDAGQGTEQSTADKKAAAAQPDQPTQEQGQAKTEAENEQQSEKETDSQAMEELFKEARENAKRKGVTD